MQVDIEDERGENTSNYIVENPNLVCLFTLHIHKQFLFISYRI